MAGTMRRSATIQVRRSAAEAMALFTPEGERTWAGPHWHPRYPTRDRTVGDGCVFLTERDGHMTVWVMVDHLHDRVRYARVTPDLHAGTVTVTVVGSRTADCHVEVTYDLTALTEHGAALLDQLGADYDAEINAWAAAINSSADG